MSYDDVLSITEVCKIIRSGTNICRRHNMHSAHSASPQHSSAQRQNRTISADGIFQSCASTPGAEMGLRRGATTEWEYKKGKFILTNARMCWRQVSVYKFKDAVHTFCTWSALRPLDIIPLPSIANSFLPAIFARLRLAGSGIVRDRKMKRAFFE